LVEERQKKFGGTKKGEIQGRGARGEIEDNARKNQDGSPPPLWRVEISCLGVEKRHLEQKKTKGEERGSVGNTKKKNEIGKTWGKLAGEIGGLFEMSGRNPRVSKLEKGTRRRGRLTRGGVQI